MAAMTRRERIYEAVAKGIWGTGAELTKEQVDEAYRITDLVLAADPQSDDGAASTAATSPAVAVSPTAPSSPIDDGAAAPPAVGAAAESATPTAAPSSPFPRRFLLYRHTDPSGVSGTGVVAEGVQFVDGRVALRWRGQWPSTVAWDDVEQILGVHGHQGATVLRWIDPEPHVGYWPVEGEPE